MPVRKNPLSAFKKRLHAKVGSVKETLKERVKPERTAVIASKARKEQDEFHKKQDRILDLRRQALHRKKVTQIKHRAKVERKRYNKRQFAKNLIRAGVDASADDIARVVFYSAVAITVLGFIAAFWFFMQDPLFTWVFGALMIALFATLGFALSYGFVWVAYHQYLDMAIYHRRKEVEDVLADFLLLTSANVRAGMTIDTALWNAVRPRFGVLAREIEIVAKRTLSGEDLNAALYDFADSYNSPLLKRSVSLLIEGLTAGGEIAPLLNDIALNIQETQIMRKEMASNVTTYAIFINFSTLIAAPILFGLAGELMKVVKRLTGQIQIDPNAMQGGGGFAFSGGSSLVYSEFLIFAILTLSLTTIFSTIIVGTIKKGSAREAIGSIPLSLTVSLALFFIASRVLGGFLGGLI